jgi:MFS superfamily sulfate permease-like transporter
MPELAGAPVQAGLYTLLGSLVVYAILGTAPQAVSAPTSGSSIMMATVVAPFIVAEPGELAELLVLLVLVVGTIFLLCGLMRLGFVIAFISHSVMTGFVFGLAIYIAVTQAPKFFGLPRGHGGTLYQLWYLIGQLAAANWMIFAIGAGPGLVVHPAGARSPGARAANDYGCRNPGGFSSSSCERIRSSRRRRRAPRIACGGPAEDKF